MKLIPTSEAFDIISFGVSSIKQTSEGIRNSFKDRIQQKQKIRQTKKIQTARLLSAKNQADKEKGLEATPKEGKVSVGKKIASTSGNILSRVLTASAAVFIGWLLDKLPKIFAWITEATAKLRKVFETVSEALTGIMGVMSDIYDGAENVVNLFNKEDTLPKDAEEVAKQMTELENDLDSARKGMESNLEETKKAIASFQPATEENPPLKKAQDMTEGDPPKELNMTQYNKVVNPEIKEQTAKGIGEIIPEEKEVEKKTKIVTTTVNEESFSMMKDVNNPEEKERILAKIEYVRKRNELIKAHGFGSDEVKAHKAERLASFSNTYKNAAGDGKESSKVLTPSGLGLDMYSRRIILNPDAARGWTRILKAAAEDGVDLTKAVTSSYRSPEKQKQLIASEDGVNVITPAPVDKSPHVQGWAVDLAVGTPEHDWMLKNASKHGWRWQGSNDPVHFDFMGGNPDNNHWMQPGKNDWMQSTMNTGEKLSSIKNSKNPIMVPMPINNMTNNNTTIPAGENKTSSPLIVTSGKSILSSLKTIDSAFT
tara:strand:- start:4046 stop:5665 length:1620 start_codon:yes stop_codon:yes gene_type:complete